MRDSKTPSASSPSYAGVGDGTAKVERTNIENCRGQRTFHANILSPWLLAGESNMKH